MHGSLHMSGEPLDLDDIVGKHVLCNHPECEHDRIYVVLAVLKNSKLIQISSDMWVAASHVRLAD